MTSRLDSSSARALLTKAGVSRVRQLDVRLLWTQSLTRSGVVRIVAIPTKENTADLGTKPLGSERIRCLLGKMGFHNAEGRLKTSQSTVSRIKSTTRVDSNMIHVVVMATLAALGHGTGVLNASMEPNVNESERIDCIVSVSDHPERIP